MASLKLKQQLFCFALVLLVARVAAQASSTASPGTCSATSLALQTYADNVTDPGILTMNNGAPVWRRNAALSVGPRGPILLQDTLFLEELGKFDRERIPERVVHAKGGGAFGYFEVTSPLLARYSKAKLFSAVGKRTPILIRFSTVGGESGTADTARDPRGFPIKFYTEEGNWDLVGNNLPVFFIRDAINFPLFVHTQKRNPATHLADPSAVWDFFSLRPEVLHMVMHVFSDLGTPDGYRKMQGHGVHTYKLVNATGQYVWAKFHYKPLQGEHNLTAAQAQALAGSNPDYANEDLYNAIAGGDFPEWDFYVQVMSQAEADAFRWNPFDATKIWPEADFPWTKVGRFVLNRNPTNYFAEIEQAAFSPSRMVPGVQPSPDRLLQGRLFSYPDTQFHRLGPNFMQLPVNCPYRVVRNYQADGTAALGNNHGGQPNYFPNSFNGPVEDPSAMEQPLEVTGPADRYDSANDSNYEQPNTMWLSFDDAQRRALIQNLAGSIRQVPSATIRARAVQQWTLVNATMGAMLQAQINALGLPCGGGDDGSSSSSTPASQVVDADVVQVNAWNVGTTSAGSVVNIVLTNTGSRDICSVQFALTLPSGTTINSSWNMDAVSGSDGQYTTPSWMRLAVGTSTNQIGMTLNGDGVPTVAVISATEC